LGIELKGRSEKKNRRAKEVSDNGRFCRMGMDEDGVAAEECVVGKRPARVVKMMM
jgi:hypothetical protein